MRRVGDLASGRAGDKGDVLDLTLVARDDAAYALLAAALDADTVRTVLNRVVPGPVRRHEIAPLRALKYVAPQALAGGVYASLRPGPCTGRKRRSGCCSTCRSTTGGRCMWRPDFHTLVCALDDAGILTVTLHRPERLNAFTVEMADELVHAFEQASADDAVRALVVTGAGRAFCAGMDLGAPDDAGASNVFGLDESLRPTLRDLDDSRLDDPEILHGLRDTGGRVTLAIHDCLKPVIAAVNGVAVGVGATMTLAMDLRIAAEGTRFGFVFGRIGIVPDACASWFLPRVVGLPKALEWTYSGELVDAQAALASGLVNRVVAQDQVLAEAQRLARQITHQRSPVALALTRQMLWRNSAADSPMEAHKVESLGLWHTSQADGKEGVRAFREKRAPRFTSQASRMPDFYPWWR